MTEQILEKKFSWQELDILRGLAALFMIINHGGYEFLIPDLATHGISGFIIFISSSAPVLFFFITGVGYGLQSGQKIQRLRYPCGTANPLFNSVMPILYVPD
jgi:uncharacterized membrane protein